MDQTNKLAFEVEYFPGATNFSVQRGYVTWSANDTVSLYVLDETTNQYSQMVFSVHVTQLTAFRIDTAIVAFVTLFVGDKKHRLKGFDAGSATANSLDMVGLGDMARSAIGVENVGAQNLSSFAAMLSSAGVKDKTLNTKKITLITTVVTISIIVLVIAIAVIIAMNE